MRPATIGGGAIGGLLLSALLVPSLYLDVPRSLISDWTTAPREAGLIGLAIAAAVVVLVGMWGGATSPSEQAKGGAIAGFVAGCVALMVVLPSTGVLGHSELITLVEGGRATTTGLKRAVVTGIVLTPGYQTLGAVSVLSGGLILGWLGGVMHDLWRGEPTRQMPALRPSPVPWVGLLGSVVAIPMQLGATLAVESVVFVELGATPTWVGKAQLTAPLALGGFVVAVLTAWISRDAMIVWRRGQRGRAMVWITAMGVMLSLLVTASVPLYWRVLILPGAIFGTLAVAVAPVIGAIVGWRSLMKLETNPRIFQDVLGEGLLAGILVSSQLALHGVSAGVVVGLLALPYRSLLLDGATKVDTTSLNSAVHMLFMGHLLLPALTFVATMAYLTIGLPMWFVSRVIKG